MPIREYLCPTCQTSFEELILRTTDESQLSCPRCGERHVQRQMSCPAQGNSASGGFSGGSNCGPVS